MQVLGKRETLCIHSLVPVLLYYFCYNFVAAAEISVIMIYVVVVANMQEEYNPGYTDDHANYHANFLFPCYLHRVSKRKWLANSEDAATKKKPSVLK